MKTPRITFKKMPRARYSTVTSYAANQAGKQIATISSVRDTSVYYWYGAGYNSLQDKDGPTTLEGCKAAVIARFSIK